MDSAKIQKVIAETLGRRHLPYRDLKAKLQQDYRVDTISTSLEVMQMKNNGLLDSMERNTVWDEAERLYLTPAGQKHFGAIYIKMVKYLFKNWIAIVALLISLVALFRH
ncbi:MAG: hypothetical protein NTV60_00515 [Candidatus Kaiserbacteria bacterium]|nr:hypothetical protein [Candidatus Kaiserbacteria bacterium]